MKKKLTPSKARAMLLELAEWFDSPESGSAVFRVFMRTPIMISDILRGTAENVASHLPRSSAKKGGKK